MSMAECTPKYCKKCSSEIQTETFYYKKGVCADCSNLARREKYKNDENYRKKMIMNATITKTKKRELKKEQYINMIGVGNKQCRYCECIKPVEAFRKNRLKCRTCERDEPLDKFKRRIRTRIYICLKGNKQDTTDTYLGCSIKEYIKWIYAYDDRFTLENYGKVWHIDHVVPISCFNLSDPSEHLIAFNWRNTAPMLATDNLKKNNKIIKEQIQTHFKKLKTFHEEHNIIMPHEIELIFAKHLDAGSSLEPLLPPICENTNGELG